MLDGYIISTFRSNSSHLSIIALAEPFNTALIVDACVFGIGHFGLSTKLRRHIMNYLVKGLLIIILHFFLNDRYKNKNRNKTIFYQTHFEFLTST